MHQALQLVEEALGILVKALLRAEIQQAILYDGGILLEGRVLLMGMALIRKIFRLLIEDRRPSSVELVQIIEIGRAHV